MRNRTNRADVVIVGGGLEGLSIAWSLARRRVGTIVVLERGTLCCGGTAKSSSIVRCHYGVASLAKMAWYGVDVFANAEEVLGTDVGYRPVGYAVGVGRENLSALRANVALQRSLGIEVDELTPTAMRERWPTMHTEDFAAFCYEPRGGRGDAYLTGMAYARQARDHGVIIRQGTAVISLSLGRGDRVTGVQTAAGERIDAGTVILANGAWSAALADRIGVNIPVRAQRAQILVVTAGEPLPELPVVSDLVSLQYFATELSGELLVGNSDHSAPEYVAPDRYSNRADHEYVERAAEKLTHRFPDWTNPGIVTSYAGCYDVTPDYNPVIGPAAAPGLFLAVGFSGHGFKLAPAVGRLCADLITEGASSDPAIDHTDFRLDRFAQGAPLLSANQYVGAAEMR